MLKLRLKSESTSRSVFFSTFFSFIAKMLSFVQAMIVSYYFGATKSTDFLFFCVSFTLLLPGLFNNINQSVIVPNAIRIRERKSDEESHKFIMYVYVFYLVAGLVVSAIVSTMPEEFMLLASKFNRADIKENLMIVKLIIPTFFFVLTSSFILNVFDSYRYFTFPMILDMLKSLLTIGFIVLLGDRYGVVSMAAGILLAHMLQFVLLNFLLVKLLGFRFKLKRYKLENTLRKNILFVVISQVSNILSQYVSIYLISGLSEGVYTALSYSDRFFNIFVLVFVGQVSTVVGINMIETHAKGQFEKLNQQYLKYLKVTMTILLPICFIMAVQAQPVMSVLLERGNFTGESVLLTSTFFKYTILIVPLLLLDRLVVGLIIAKQILHVSFIWNVISKILSGAVVYIIVNHMDYRYYGLGLLFVQLVYIILINLFMVKKQFKYINVNESLKYLAISVSLCVALNLAISRVFPTGNYEGVLKKLAALCIYSVLVLGSYYIIGFITYNRGAILLLLKYFQQIAFKHAGLRVPQINRFS